MSAVDEYQREAAARFWTTMTDLESAGEKAIVELEAENERLQVCGNCEHLDHDSYHHFHQCLVKKKARRVLVTNQCIFTPSRWQARP